MKIFDSIADLKNHALVENMNICAIKAMAKVFDDNELKIEIRLLKAEIKMLKTKLAMKGEY